MFLTYRVIPDTEADAIVTRLKKIQRDRERAFAAFRLANDLPDDNCEAYGTHQEVAGFGLSPYAKPGWKWSKKFRTNVPDRKTPEGKEIAKQLKALPPGIDKRRESSEIFGHGLVMSSCRHGFGLSFAQWGWSRKGAVVAMAPAVKAAAKKWPKGLREIPLSVANKIVEME